MTVAEARLIRVTDGVYRDRTGGIFVLRLWGARVDENRWLVRWRDGLGCRIERRFFTLAEARNYIRSL